MHTLAVTLIVISEILKCKEMSDLEEKKKTYDKQVEKPKGKAGKGYQRRTCEGPEVAM